MCVFVYVYVSGFVCLFIVECVHLCFFGFVCASFSLCVCLCFCVCGVCNCVCDCLSACLPV